MSDYIFKGAPPRSPSTTRVNERLQARLARAIASRSPSSGSSTIGVGAEEQISRPHSPLRSSTDSQTPLPTTKEREPNLFHAPENKWEGTISFRVPGVPDQTEAGLYQAERASGDGVELTQSMDETPGRDISQHPATPSAIQRTSSAIQSPRTSPQDQHGFEESRSDPEAETSDLQGEYPGYVERIDRLEAKLQYLAREVSETARSSIVSLSQNHVERKLAEKDERIGLLMEEGQKLATTEQKLRATIRKLRIQIQDSERSLQQFANTQATVYQELQLGKASADHLHVMELELESSRDDNVRLQGELKDITRQLNDRSLAMERFCKEEEELSSKKGTEAANMDKQAETNLKARCKELEDRVSELQIEKKLVADRAQIRATELGQQLDASISRAQTKEKENDLEIKRLESNLEVMRIQTEEIFSTATADVQAKLLRQVETLQSQYAIASKNWEGIELSLIAKTTNMERERDDALRRESELRKKARNAVGVPTQIPTYLLLLCWPREHAANTCCYRCCAPKKRRTS